MPKLRINLLEGRCLLDLASYAKPGPGRRNRLSPEQLAQISRTVRRVPEAVVKVLSKDSNNLSSVKKHFDYIGRYGDLELETDDGNHIKGRDVGLQLIEDWDLDLDEHRRQSNLGAAVGRKPPKLVHKLMLSMPPGTPSQGLLAAARNFLREEFALQHRYVFVLHTDEPHPHVHAVVKAVSEQSVRLHIRKATLREWRREFARHLRDQGIAANATERAVRGQSRAHKKDGIFRAVHRGVSTHMRERVEAVAVALTKGDLQDETSKAQLVRTRTNIERGWQGASDILVNEGYPELAADVRRFVAQMPPPRTEKEQIASELLQRGLEQRVKDRPTAR